MHESECGATKQPFEIESREMLRKGKATIIWHVPCPELDDSGHFGRKFGVLRAARFGHGSGMLSTISMLAFNSEKIK